MRKRKFGWMAVCGLAVLLSIATAGSVLAWLTDSAEPVTNTFTVGRVRLKLTETWNTDTDGDEEPDGWTGKLVPGTKLHKDPRVHVAKGSEDCWVFVQVREENWPEAKETDGITPKVTYAIAEGWMPLSEEKDVFYRSSLSADEVREYPVLAEDLVSISQTLTRQEIEALSGMNLSLTAWAVQCAGLETAEAAWNSLKA